MIGYRPRLMLLDRYVLGNLLPPFALAFSAFLLFWFINIFFLAADQLINAHAPPFLVLRFLLFRVPQSTPYAFPFATLFASLLGFGQLANGHEINAMRTAGISFFRIARGPLLAGFAIFLLSYTINDRITPQAVSESTQSFYQIIYHTASLPIEPNIFRRDPATERVFYVGSVSQDRRTMYHVMIFDPARNSSFRQVLTAEQSEIRDQRLVLHNATIVRFKPSGLVDGETTGAEISIGLPSGEELEQFLRTSGNDIYTMNTSELGAQIAAMERTGQGGNAADLLKVTLAQRIALPFASFVAVLLALPLAVGIGNYGRAVGVAMAIVLLFCYYLLSAAAAAVGRNGALDPYLAAWLPNLCMAGVGTVLFLRLRR